MPKLLNYSCETKIATLTEQYKGEREVTTVIVDFSGMGVDTWAKWIDIKLNNNTGSVISLGTGVIGSYVLQAPYVARVGTVQVQPYAISDTGQRQYFAKFDYYVQKTLDVGAEVILENPDILADFMIALNDKVDKRIDADLMLDIDKTKLDSLSTAPHTYVHNQIAASAEWVVAHNLNRYPSVTVVDTGNNTVGGDIIYNSLNVLTVTFSSAFSGKAFIN
jgi:hypothetical protein